MLATNLGCKCIHVPGNLLISNPRIQLGGLDVGVAEHLGDALDGHPVFEGDGGGESVPGITPMSV